MHKQALLLLVFSALLAGCVPHASPSHSTNNSTGNMGSHGSGSSLSGSTLETFVPGETVDITALPDALPSQRIEVSSGQTINLNPIFVRKTINGKTFVMYGYNGSIPGPFISVVQGTTFYVEVENKIELPTTVHWHGIRLANPFDGVPGITQKEILPNGRFRYTVTVPDEGIFWYHPHVREDIQVAMGLFGNVLSKPPEAIAPVNREEAIVLSDLLLGEDGMPVPFAKNGANYTMMGRFGNTLLTNGETTYALSVSGSSVVRFYVTNMASTRPYRLSFSGAQMKLVGTDVGNYERESLIDEFILGSGERAIVDVYFPKPGSYPLVHRSGGAKKYILGTVSATSEVAKPLFASAFNTLREYPDVLSSLPVESYLDTPPDKTLRISVSGMGHVGRDLEDGIEWEDINPAMNARSTNANIQWKLVDDDTGKANMDIEWNFKKGDLVKILIKNDFESMQHPIHFHGQRFLVLQDNGVEPDLRAWKDTYLLKNGAQVEILLEASNPGTWMFHCHIAEHLQNGMMGVLKVEE